jgi:hypothetical protein
MRTLSALVLALSGAVVAVAAPAPEATFDPDAPGTLIPVEVRAAGGCAVSAPSESKGLRVRAVADDR